MDWVGPSIEIVKLVGGRFVRYLKYQIKYNDLLQKFEQSKQRLRSRKHEIESKREAQLESAPYHVATAGVEDWLKEVEEFIGRQDVVDEVNSWGYLSCCCRAVILEERTQELKEIYDRGDNYTRDCLVIEDQSQKLNHHVQKFNEWKGNLQRIQEDTGSKLNSQLRHGKIEMKQVKHWRGKVEEMLKGVKDIEDKIGGSPSHSSDSLVVFLGEQIREMETTCKEGSQLPDCLVIDDPSDSQVDIPTPDSQGNEAVKGQILACLKGEEVTMLGVWGMGGVGKTTIMKHVHNELLKESKFKKIIWVTVSQNFDIYNLQEQIACSLKEKLEERQNTIKRAATLSKMLETHKPYLLILDDVWNSFKLEDVGIPKPNVTNGCKLVLTTRSQEVARSMDCRRIKVKTLSQEEALKLFLDKVGDTALSCPGGGIEEDLESTLKDIVDECAGLPLALVTVAGSLKEISESRLWSVALNQLRDYKRNVAGTDDVDAFQILKFSYDRLKNQQMRYCFLYCALYPEDHKIPKEEIIENWIDEGFINEMESRQSMKDEGYGILRKLEDNSLLELIEDKDSEDEDSEDEVSKDCVRMHDLVRDMALDITRMSPRFLVEAGKALKELPERVNCAEGVEKVSFMHNCIEEIPSSLAFSTCVRLTTLLLAHNRLSTIPEPIFEHMSELKILDLSFNEELKGLPNSVSKLVKLTTLLLESTFIEKVPSLSRLGSLKKLNLRRTKIKEVPEGLGMLKNLKCLFLCGSEIDEIADGVLSNLSKLQELIVDRIRGDVVGRMKKLEVFHGWFPTANEMRIFVKCQPDKLSSYVITIGRNLHRGHDFQQYLLRYKKRMVFTETSIVGENMLFPSIQVLCIEACHDIRSLNDFSTIKDATDLRGCKIFNCNGMECIFSSWINNPIVQTIEYLDLCVLDKLDGLFEANIIAKSSPPPRTFSSLKEVYIVLCIKLKKLFPSWMLVEYLQSLESVHVRDCKEMEEIIASDPEEEGEEGGDIIKNLILPKLKWLTLLQLPALKSICGRRAVMVCDSLESITIGDCKGLRRIPFRLPPCLSLYELDNLDWVFEVELIAMSPPQPCTFLSLKKIKLQKFRRVKKLFPSWKFVEYLQNLEQIDIRDFEEMEEIIALDPEEEGEEGRDIIKKLILPKLKMLLLWDLPALKSICSRRALMVCDSLESIDIRDCKGLRRIPFHLPPRLFLYELDNLDWVFEVELIAMSPPQPCTFSSLKEVCISSCNRANKLFPSWKFMEYLQSLERIHVGYCEEMEEIIASDPEEEGEEGRDIVRKLILPKLKWLELYQLPALKSICNRRAIMVCDSLESITIGDCKGLRRIPFHLLPRLFLYELDNLDWVFEVELIAMSPPQPSTFSSLKEVKISKCKRAKKLFPSWKCVEYLQSLERIEVHGCEEMEEIIASDPEEEGEEGGDIIKKLILPKLKWLTLETSPALKSICSRRAVMVCDSLQDIHIKDCKGIRRIPFHLPPRLALYELDNLDWLFEVELITMSPPQPHPFSFLREVEIRDCKKIKKLFPSWKFLEYLQSLESIWVTDCTEMEEMIASDPEEEEGGDIIKKLILPKLKQLRLWYLPKLKSICSRRAVIVCDFLESITIEDCKGLRRIPLSLPLVDNAQPSPPPSLKKIYMYRREEEWWESLEWDHPNAKDVLQPMVRFFPSGVMLP